MGIRIQKIQLFCFLFVVTGHHGSFGGRHEVEMDPTSLQELLKLFRTQISKEKKT